MKTLFFSVIILSIFTLQQSRAQTSPASSPSTIALNPWAAKQLIEPIDLAAIIKDPGPDKPVIFNIGAVDDIQDAKHIGPANVAANLAAFKAAIQSLPKNTLIVIYCGCCPFAKCPNIRPAFFELKKLGFTNFRLLNLPTNLKTDWISKGYPLAAK